MVKLDENPDKTIRSEVKSSVLLTSLGDSFQTSAVGKHITSFGCFRYRSNAEL